MIVLLLPMFWSLAFFCSYMLLSSSRPRRRLAFLQASIVTGVFVSLGAEILGARHVLAPGPLTALWSLGVLLLAILAAGLTRVRHVTFARFAWPDFNSFEALVSLGVAMLLAVTGAVAFVAAPNNWDSMTYHLGRVAHWVQNHSVDFYPTAILRQLYPGPAAEYAILQLQILSGGDRFSNLVQWWALLGCTVAATLIAEHFGAGPRGQVFAAAVTVSAPMAILQASSTQNDLVVAFWLACAALFCMMLHEERRLCWAIWVGLAAGLAILTKGTAYIFLVPVLAYLLPTQWGQSTWTLAKAITIIASLVLLLNAGQYARNFELFGSPLGADKATEPYLNARFGLDTTASNIVRNAALHVVMPNRWVNATITDVIRRIHGVLGLDPDDPATTWPGRQFKQVWSNFHEDAFGNSAHFLLILAAAVAVLLNRGTRQTLRPVRGYALAIMISFLLFCALLRWQPWHSRLHLPLFVLIAPVVGIIVATARQVRLANAIIAILLLLAIGPAFLNGSRPLIGSASILNTPRIRQYFANRPELATPYAAGVEFLAQSGCRQVGLYLGGNDWEYPLWVLGGRLSTEPIRWEHVAVSNRSGSLHLTSPFRPCAIISVGEEPPTELDVDGLHYGPVWSSAPIVILQEQHVQ